MKSILMILCMMSSSAFSQSITMDEIKIKPIISNLEKERILGRIGDEGGHGGSSSEIEWLEKAQQAFAITKMEVSYFGLNAQQLRNWRSAIVGNVIVIADDNKVETINKKFGKNKDAYNFPNEKPQAVIVFSPSRFDKKTELEKLVLVFHEYMGILGVERDRYTVSLKFSAFTAKIRSEAIDFSKEKVIFEQAIVPFSSGYLLGSRALEICSYYVKNVSAEYELLYCTFYDKLGQPLVYKTPQMDEKLLLGYTSAYNFSSKSETTSTPVVVHGIYKNKLNNAVEKYSPPASFADEFKAKVHSIKINAIPKDMEGGPRRTLHSSLSLVDGSTEPLYFSTAESAVMVCDKFLYGDDLINLVDYAKYPECIVIQDPELPSPNFYFEVRIAK